MKPLSDRRLFPVLVVVLAIVASALPLVVDGWWLYIGANGRYDMSGRVAIAVSTWVGVVAGLVARERRPENPIGSWLAITGLLGPLGFMVGGSVPVLVFASGAAFTVAAMIGAAVPITFPSGRLDGGAKWTLLVIGATCVVYRVQQVAFFDPIVSIPGWTEPNPFLVHVDPDTLGRLNLLYSIYGIAFLVLFGAWLARRWWRLTGPARLSIAPVLAGALVFVVASTAQAAVEGAGVHGQVTEVMQFAHTLSFSAIPVGLMAGLLRVQMKRSAIADLVVELGETPEPAELRRALATALDDPSIEVLLWDDAAGGYADAAGERVGSLELAAGSRAVTLLEREGRPLAAILHDPALRDDPSLVASVATAVRLTVENDRLQAEVQAQLAEVRASRARIVEATDAERRRVERDIHDGAQQRLVALSLAVARARGRAGAAGDVELEAALAQAGEEARAALAELRELARGIHPAVLTEAGLEAAVRSLVDRSAVPTELDVDLPERLPAPVEATAYFVVSEALANVAKHAEATCACVSLAARDARLVVEIRDDGRGGAEPRLGSGLRGLADRVEAMSGRLEVTSATGAGTTIRAVLPVGEVSR